MRRLMLITSQLQYQFSLFPTCSVFNSQKLLSTTGAVPCVKMSSPFRMLDRSASGWSVALNQRMTSSDPEMKI